MKIDGNHASGVRF